MSNNSGNNDFEKVIIKLGLVKEGGECKRKG